MQKILGPAPTDIPSPRVREFQAYWQGKRVGDRLPARADLRPEEIVPLLPHLFLVDVLPGGEGFRYRLIGTRIAAWTGGDATGWRLDDPRCGEGGAVLQALLREVCDSGRPLLTAGMPAIFGGSRLLFDRLLSPLAADGRTVDMVVGVADGRLPG